VGRLAGYGDDVTAVLIEMLGSGHALVDADEETAVRRPASGKSGRRDKAAHRGWSFGVANAGESTAAESGVKMLAVGHLCDALVAEG
jgi:hypothetical protein